MRIDEEKYVNLIMYILFKCLNKPNLGKTVLCTIMYFIDFNYYEKYGTFLTKETYIKSRKGVKPKHFRKITQNLIDRKKLFLRREPYYTRTIHRYYPTTLPTPKFTPEELNIINSSIKNLSDSNATTITRFAWHDLPLINAELGEEIAYDDVFLRQ